MITAVIIARNEEHTIGRALESVAFCDERIVVDTHSSDNTSPVAQDKGAKVVLYPDIKEMDFSEVRNKALTYASYEWVLFVDADEVVSKELAEEIQKAVAASESGNESRNDAGANKYGAFYIPRADIFWGQTMKWGEVLKSYRKGIIRLVKKDSGAWWGKVHETYRSEKSVGKLNNVLIHYPHPTVAEFLRDINLYSTIRANEMFFNGEKTSIIALVCVPFLKFFYTYVVLLGFLDGPAGFVYSFVMMFHSFLVRSKLMMLWKEKTI